MSPYFLKLNRGHYSPKSAHKTLQPSVGPLTGNIKLYTKNLVVTFHSCLDVSYQEIYAIMLSPTIILVTAYQALHGEGPEYI